MRSHLSNVIGILGLLTDGSSVTDSAERDELTASAYDMTLTMLEEVKALEKASRDRLAVQSVDEAA